MNEDYQPRFLPRSPLNSGEFIFAAAFLDHPHIYDQCRGLIAAGATLSWVYDPDAERVTAFQRQFPQVRVARTWSEVLDDATVRLVTAAAIPDQRSKIGCEVMRAGKDYLTDKPPFTSLEQLAETRKVVSETKQKYAIFYGDRLGVECAVHASRLIELGVIGTVLQVIGLGPHRLNRAKRPAWFFQRQRYGGILCDLGSHQCEKFLAFSGSTEADVLTAAVANRANPADPELEDYGEATLVGNTGARSHYRVDWLTPDGLSTWGDGRTFVLGTRGTIELRSFCDVGINPKGELLILVDGQGEHRISCAGQVGLPFYGDLLQDCLARTEHAQSQAHAFKAAELSLRCQTLAVR